MVSFNCRISPETLTVIFFDRSPCATAVATSAMLRTWPVRFDAMELTLSVRSFQVPATPRTTAWPPSLPSVPTSRATRVTSEAKARSWSTIVLMVSLSWRISPRTSTVIFFDRSPLATAVVTSAMFRTWAVRFPAIELTLSVRSLQVPARPFTTAWPPSCGEGPGRHLEGPHRQCQLDGRKPDCPGAKHRRRDYRCRQRRSVEEDHRGRPRRDPPAQRHHQHDGGPAPRLRL